MSFKDILGSLKTYRINSNSYISRHEPIKVVLIATLSTLSLCWLYDFIYREESVKKRLVRGFFNIIHRIPPIKHRIDKEVNKNIAELEKSFNTSGDQRLVYYLSLPKKGWNKSEVEREATKYLQMETVKWKEGYVSGTVYVNNEELNELMTKIYRQFMWSNPLHPDTFPDVRKMEAEVVRMCCSMYNGDAETCGTTTSGGTESIMLAMKTYRDIAYDRGVRIPEMVVPVTAHAAFDKAAHYFRMKIHHVPVDPVTYKVDMAAFKSAINRSTCVLVGSAPEFAHGIIDPIESISQLGERYGVPVHVDCCLGGFLMPFIEQAGFQVDEIFDFRLPGVISISCDSHKYGFAPKGSSIVMYRSHKYRKHQFFVQPDWPGGVYACPTFAGSRAGVIIATCWATMMYFGVDGYVKSTREIVAATMKIKEGLQRMDDISVVGDPRVCVLALRSELVNVYNLQDGLCARGWHLNPLQYPQSVHIAVTHVHTAPGIVERFLQDVGEEMNKLRQLPARQDEGSAAIYGMSQSIPDRSLVSDIATGFIAACYNTNNEN